MRKSLKKRVLVFALILLFAVLIRLPVCQAAHPLITDDTGTQGKGKFQVEVNSEFGWDEETTDDVRTKEKGGEVSTIFSYGVAERADLVIGVPYRWNKVKEDGETTSDEDGLSDISLELKWRLWETEGLSFALKPGLTVPTGEEEKGLGTGRVTASLFFITTAETGPWAFQLNVGYLRNENRVDEEKNLWHASLAVEVEMVKDLKLVGNIGAERNTDSESNEDPAFILGGLIYSVTENLDIDFGVKGGLNLAETDLALLAGMAFRF